MIHPARPEPLVFSGVAASAQFALKFERSGFETAGCSTAVAAESSWRTRNFVGSFVPRGPTGW